MYQSPSAHQTFRYFLVPTDPAVSLKVLALLLPSFLPPPDSDESQRLKLQRMILGIANRSRITMTIQTSVSSSITSLQADNLILQLSVIALMVWAPHPRLLLLGSATTLYPIANEVMVQLAELQHPRFRRPPIIDLEGQLV